MKKTLALLVLAALCTTGVAFAGDPKDPKDSKEAPAPVRKESTENVKKADEPKLASPQPEASTAGAPGHKAAKPDAPLKTDGAAKEAAPAK